MGRLSVLLLTVLPLVAQTKPTGVNRLRGETEAGSGYALIQNRQQV